MADFLEKKETSEFRLKRYYYVADLAGIFLPLLIGAFMYLYPEYFPWIIHPKINLAAFLAVVIFQTVNFILYEIFHLKIFFNLARYIYVLFFVVFIYATGGTESTFIFLLAFPIVVSAVDLNPGMTKRVGIAVCILLAALILTEPARLYEPIFLIKHFLKVSIFGFFAYLMYKLVRETLLQKYEKEEVNRKFVQLIQVDQLKNDFLIVAQHQLRTPLSGVRWALQTLAEDPTLVKEKADLMRASVSRVDDAISIVNGMLQTVEHSAGTITLARENVDMVDLVQSVLKELSYVATRKNVSVNFESPPSIIASLDPRMLKPSIINIIDNAFKYSPEGKVDIILTDQGDDIVLTVSDNGIGISAEDAPFIFQRLFRGKNAIALEADESGVGLYIAKRAIELHGGTITLESNIGKGTKVTVTLPKN